MLGGTVKWFTSWTKLQASSKTRLNNHLTLLDINMPDEPLGHLRGLDCMSTESSETSLPLPPTLTLTRSPCIKSKSKYKRPPPENTSWPRRYGKMVGLFDCQDHILLSPYEDTIYTILTLKMSSPIQMRLNFGLQQGDHQSTISSDDSASVSRHYCQSQQLNRKHITLSSIVFVP